MKPTLAAIVAAVSVAIVISSPAGADTFVAAGYSLPSLGPFQIIAGKDEVCAPAAGALRQVGVQVTAADGGVELRAPDGTTVAVRVGSDRATIGGVERLLPAAPSRREGNLYLPVRALAWYLGLAYRWDENSRTIFLHPKVAGITFSRLPDKVRVKITGTGRLAYAAGVLKEPPRIYVDISNADLFAAEQQIAVNEGDLISVRASQHSLNPDLVRVVLTLKRECSEYTHAGADSGRSVVVDIPAPPTPPAAAGRVVVIRSVRLERRSDSVCRLVVEADGAPVASLSTRRDPPQVAIELSNVRLTAEKVEGSHPVVASASAEQTGENEARITLDLERPQPAALVRRAQGLCALIGSVALSDVTVVLDPGHGGRQPGASGPSGLMEKEVNLDVALRAERLLREQGVQVILTRKDDSSLIPVTNRDELRRELTMRAQLANNRNADVFIAIHCNSSPRGAPRRIGTETYYCTSRSIGFARAMQQELLGELKLNDGGIHARDFVVVKTARMPAVLLELAYLNDRSEEGLLGSPRFRERAAQAIVSGVRRFAEGGGLLEYYAELEGGGATQAVVQQARPEPTTASAEEAKPDSGASPRAPAEKRDDRPARATATSPPSPGAGG